MSKTSSIDAQASACKSYSKSGVQTVTNENGSDKTGDVPI